MQEQLFKDFLAVVAEIAREVAIQVIHEEVPKIFEKKAQPGDILSDSIDYNTACELLRISKPTLHKYINEGKLTKHSFTDGGKPYLSRNEIQKIVKRTRRISPSITFNNFRQVNPGKKTEAA